MNMLISDPMTLKYWETVTAKIKHQEQKENIEVGIDIKDQNPEAIADEI